MTRGLPVDSPWDDRRDCDPRPIALAFTAGSAIVVWKQD